MHSFASSFENKGIVALASNLAAMQTIGAEDKELVEITAQFMRERLIASMLMQAEMATGAGKNMIINFVRALQTHGRYEAKFTSETPINLVGEGAIEAVGNAIQSSFTPAAQ